MDCLESIRRSSILTSVQNVRKARLVKGKKKKKGKENGTITLLFSFRLVSTRYFSFRRHPTYHDSTCYSFIGTLLSRQSFIPLYTIAILFSDVA